MMRRSHRLVLLVFLVLLGWGFVPAGAQEPAAPQLVPEAQLLAAIDRLGDLDYDTRSAAARLVRRSVPGQVVPALLRAVAEHADGYVRYRALVLLTGFNDQRTKGAVVECLKSPNDRLRTVAYSYLEHNPDAAMIGDLLAALETEQGEFVRPALVRALAAHGDDVRVQKVLTREATRGEDFFRSAVIEALGDYHARYAFDVVNSIAKLEGPLQDDASVALGKMGDKRALETLAALQRSAPRATQPSLAAAICLLGVNCEAHESFIIETLKFADQNTGFQELLRSAAGGLAALGVAGRAGTAQVLFDLGVPSQDPTRAPVALAVGMVALRNTPVMMKVLEGHPDRTRALALLAEGFDMLEEDLDKERFFVFARRTYWASDEGSATRRLMETLIDELKF
jgi:hypothetical protein